MSQVLNYYDVEAIAGKLCVGMSTDYKVFIVCVSIVAWVAS